MDTTEPFNPRLQLLVKSSVWNQVDVDVHGVRCVSVVDGDVAQIVDRVEHLTTAQQYSIQKRHNGG